MSDTSRYVANEFIVERVRYAIEMNNPNEPEEYMDEAAIQDIANYAGVVGLVEVHDDGDVIDELFDPSSPNCRAYFLYDVLKWTRANGFTVELDDELI